MNLDEKLKLLAEKHKEDKTPKREFVDDKKPEFVQFQNPLNKKWLKLETKTGRVVAQTKSEKPFKGIMDGKEYLKNRKH